MRFSQLLGCFDDLGDGFFAGEQGEEEAVSGICRWDFAEEVGRFGHNLSTMRAPLALPSS
jgi:hypothetical protein